ncbi:putative Histone-lysine n-methyltransferase, suvh [Heracleum sosnowskyi]|uniref:Histone-lysine n-methyltransferase, suvh n=1 Tax=Heracleum sosnowskyi TaxID=360622 RepID=A0AAD8IQ56_9APIA|nr:putative Histone-lysine n-methyltransferase, suvh [Heracleum sosnowskyi]
MHSKQSPEHVSWEGFAKRGSDKRLRVDQHRVRYLNLESETREIEPSLFPGPSGLSAPAPATGKSTEQLVSYDKKVVDSAKERNKGKVVMRPPKVVKTALLAKMGINGISEPVYFNNQNSKDSSSETHKDSQPPKNLDNAEHGLLLEVIRKDNEVGFPDDEVKRESEEDAKKDKVGFSSAKSIKATQFGKSVTPSASEKSLDTGEGSSIVCSSQSNSLKSNLRVHLVDGNRFAGGTNNDYQADLCRDKVRKVLDLFKETLVKLQREQEMKAKGGIKMYIDAAMQLKERHPWVNVNKSLGAVPGVEIGDCFQSRAELVIIGLHGKFIAGIDYMNRNGKLLATSIIASDRYGDKNPSSDVLTYMGEGGNDVFSSEKPVDQKLVRGNSKKPEDQKLVRGNLALKNSKDEESPVRVIRSYQNIMMKSQLVYDGLYIVSDCWEEVEPCGRLVYKFQLNKMQGQQKLIRRDTMNGLRNSNKASCGPIVLNDISEGKEKIPIRVVNAVDCEKPPPFKYITKMMYHPQLCVISKPSLCDCLSGCAEDISCSCVIKNNSEVSVNRSVSIAGKKPIVYECGSSCKCPLDCDNQKSQDGIKLQLEVFRTSAKGWGVRSRNFISEGRFICEYVGELLRYNQEGRIDFDKSTFDAGNSHGSEDSLYPISESGSSSIDQDDTEIVKFGNVGRFMRYSCSPNLYAKCVVYDDEDNSRPHVMLFAAKNITPKTELTFDYELW